MPFALARLIVVSFWYAYAWATVGFVYAQTKAFDIHPDFVAQQWTMEDGLPSNAIGDILQTPDGYLWLATDNGLARFDGLRFMPFTTSNTPALPNNRIAKLFVSQAGALWIQTHQFHVLVYQNGEFSKPLGDEPINSVYNKPSHRNIWDEGDSLWFATNQGLSLYANGYAQPYRPDEIQGHGWVLLRDRAGTLWMGTYSGAILAIRPNGTVQRFSEANGLHPSRIHDLFEAQDGTLWAGTRDGIYHFEEQENRFIPHRVRGER
ncbi:MAG: hypothetical protein RhofKO_40350 [Rhodothermales bacterium]